LIKGVFKLKEVLNLGHRGASEAAPENTIPAFVKALEQGASGIELDVRLSADNAVVVIHNRTVDKTTDGSGPVSSLTLARLKTLDAGSWFSPEYSGTLLPTLEETIESLNQEAFINIEIKSGSLIDTRVEKKVAGIINRYNLYGRTVVSSFNPLSLLRIRKIDRRIPVGLLYLPAAPGLLVLGPLNLIAPDALHPYYKKLTPSYVVRAQAKGYRVNVWTVNSREDMERMLELGVDGIITDRPELLARVLEERGLS
jgi:glycerophosphoryl diester phosphodiesterase